MGCRHGSTRPGASPAKLGCLRTYALAITSPEESVSKVFFVKAQEIQLRSVKLANPRRHHQYLFFRKGPYNPVHCLLSPGGLDRSRRRVTGDKLPSVPQSRPFANPHPEAAHQNPFWHLPALGSSSTGTASGGQRYVKVLTQALVVGFGLSRVDSKVKGEVPYLQPTVRTESDPWMF